MYSNTRQRIEEIARQLEDLGYTVVECEGEEYSEAMEKMETLQEELEFLQIHQADMETMREYLGECDND